MNKVYLCVAMLIALVGSAAAQEICASNSECDDQNECTIDSCGTSIAYPDSATMVIDYGSCMAVPVYDGMPCHNDGKLGKCVAGTCERNNAHASGRRASAQSSEAPAEPTMSVMAEATTQVPEFSAIAASLAFAGAGAGYMLIRKMG